MRKLFNFISGIILGLTPLIGAGIIGIAIYASFPNMIGIIIGGILILLSLWAGFKIFKRIQIVGPIEFMTASHASPDLDNLEPTKDSETKRRTPNELVELISNDENLIKDGSMRIYGDWFGEPHKNFHETLSARFKKESSILTLNFKDGAIIEITNPINIFEASTFLKIISADRIKLTFFKSGKATSNEKLYYLDYRKEQKKILTDSNVDWYKPNFDVSLGDPALMIYGGKKVKTFGNTK